MSTTLQWLDSHTSTIRIANDECCCINCKHFQRHYIKESEVFGGGYTPISVGHCKSPRLKNKRAMDICNNFEPVDSQYESTPSPI